MSLMKMRRQRLTLAIILLMTTTAFLFPSPVLAWGDPSSDEPVLSPYWPLVVSRWEPIIVRYAEQRNLDPDLVAAVVWKESLGQAKACSYAGAVGLMGIMPFEWRPTPEELENPWTNVFWGARALAHTIRDGNGDLYYSLAAYNGGWEKTHRPVPRAYAASVLDHYTRAVAMQHGLDRDGTWFAIIAAEETAGPGTTTVLGPHRPLTRYTERPWNGADIPTVPADVPPHATALTFVDERGVECRVNLWLVAADGSPLASSTKPSHSPPHSHSPLVATVRGVRGPNSTLTLPEPVP